MVGHDCRVGVLAVDENVGALFGVADGILLDDRIALSSNMNSDDCVADEEIAPNSRRRPVENGTADAAVVDDVVGEGAEAVVVDKDAVIHAVVKRVLGEDNNITERVNIDADCAGFDVVADEATEATLADSNSGAA